MTTSSQPRTLQEAKDLIKGRVDFAEIVGRYTQLTPMGHRLRGRCPFHKEKTPSFYVNPHEKFFHCFGCEAGGDVFSFLMKMEGLSFMEVMRELAGSIGIELPRAGGGEARPALDSEKKPERAEGYEFLERATKFYHRVLMSAANPEAREALAYLQERGIPTSEIEELELGWAPDSGRELLKRLKDGRERELAGKVGILRDGRTGQYEFFRSRLMIPIRDTRGRTCAFSGRTLQPVGDQNPKYKNSPENAWFKKKELLYGLDRAAKFIREHDFVCLVEGYFDQWAFHRHGVPSVAVMGTALSDEHIATLERYTRRIVLVLDSDRAGLESTLKVIPRFVLRGWSVMVFSGFEGKDPDEGLAGYAGRGTELVQQLLSSPEAVVWWIQLLLKESLAAGSNRYECFRRLAEPWKYALTKAHKTVIADEVGRVLGLPAQSVWDSLGELASKDAKELQAGSYAAASAPTSEMVRVTANAAQAASRGPIPTTRNPSGESEAIVWWVRYWDLLTPRSEAEWLERTGLFAGKGSGAGVELLCKKAASAGWMLENFSPTDWLEILSESEQLLRSWIQQGLVLRDGPDSAMDPSKALTSFREISSILLREKVFSEIARLQAEIRSAHPGSPRTPQLLQRVQELRISLENNR